jgi:hypothetical protein
MLEEYKKESQMRTFALHIRFTNTGRREEEPSFQAEVGEVALHWAHSSGQVVGKGMVDLERAACQTAAVYIQQGALVEHRRVAD